MKILLIVFILIVLSILLSIKKENFVNSFDDILDKKCTELNQNLNNYIGPWDGENGRCGTYTCPTETCSYIVKDNNIRNIDAYTYKQETKEKILRFLDNNERECISRNGEPVTNSDAVANSTYNCVDDITNSIRNSPTHNEIDFCYEPIDQGDTLRWSKQTYVNVMNADGTYNWKNIDSGVINDMTPESCIKEPLDCSQCNYYCCEYYTGKDKEKKCTKQTATNADTYIHYNLKRQFTPSGTSFYCEPGNTCAIIDCNYTNSNFYKDCWVYKDDFDDSSKREWINKRFERQTLIYNNEEICDFFHKDENDIMIRHKDVESMCKDDPPDINADECGIKPTIKCTYLDKYNSAFDVDYKSVLNNRGDACIYQTLTNEDRVYTDHPQELIQTQVVLEADADKVNICPELSPRDCIPQKPAYEELFLDKSINDDKTSYKCSTCPPGTYRNGNEHEQATNVDDACTPEAICPSVNDCNRSHYDDNVIEGSLNCKSCWSNMDDGGDILKKVFQEITPNRDKCKIVKDICYYTKDDNDSNVLFEDCQPDKKFTYAGYEYCDNCPPGQAIKVEDDYLVCKNIIDCGEKQDNKCLNADKLEFSTYINDNKFDKFSECVYWKYNQNTDENKKNDCLVNDKCIEECKVICPSHKIENTAKISLVRDGDFCRSVYEL